jgi:hypothetical protein
VIPTTLRVLCEGQTEQNFVIQVLGPHFQVFASPESLVCPIIAANTGLPRLRGACPRFDSWVRRLEQLSEDL